MTIPPRLAKGYELFRREQFPREVERYKMLALGQRPETMLIACADSRVDPATIFQSAPGELFVIRNVAALVPPCEKFGSYHGTSAAIEFAVRELRVKKIVVMGHAQCGGIAASLRAAHNATPAGHFIGPWVALIDEVRRNLLTSRPHQTADERQQTLEELSVKQSLLNLTTFSFVADAMTRGELELHGAWFSIGRGELKWLNHERGAFEVVSTITRSAKSTATVTNLVSTTSRTTRYADESS